VVAKFAHSKALLVAGSLVIIAGHNKEISARVEGQIETI
jgi:hypothetical protein